MAVTVYENDSRLNWLNAAWASGVNYNVHDALQHNGTSYRCIVAHGSLAATEPGVGVDWATRWAVVAAKGEVGAPGVDGTDGVDGITKYNIVYAREGAAAVAAGQMRWYAPAACTISIVRAAVGTAPTGASLIVDVNKNGVTIFTTQANRPTIAAAAFDSGNVINMNIVALAAGDYITVDIDQVGSTVAGSDLVVEIFITEP